MQTKFFQQLDWIHWTPTETEDEASDCSSKVLITNQWTKPMAKMQHFRFQDIHPPGNQQSDVHPPDIRPQITFLP